MDAVTEHIVIKRRRTLADPTKGLMRTHKYASGANILIAQYTNAIRYTLADNITFEVWVKQTSISPNGVIFEIGNGPNGACMWFDSALGVVGFGGGNNNTSTGVAMTKSWTNYANAGAVQLVGALKIGTCEGCFWIDGHLVGRATGSTPPMGGGFWSASGDGMVGGVNGTVATRVPLASRVALSNAVVVGTLNVYTRQLPRHFSGGRLY